MSKQAEMERVFTENPQHDDRKAALRWLTAPRSQAPDRERIPVGLLTDCAINESSGIWMTGANNMRAAIIRAMGQAAVDNEPERAELVAALESLTTERTLPQRERDVAVEVLAEIRGRIGPPGNPADAAAAGGGQAQPG